MAKLRIFISCVSGQFKACRDALRSDLAAVGADVIVQEDFRQHGGTLLEKLQEEVASCDRLIALAGNAYGWEPEQGVLPEGTPRRSYTQWEYFFARGERLDGSRVTAKPAYVYFADPTYLQRNPVEQSDTEAGLQQSFIQGIHASNKDYLEFGSLDELARLVLRDGFTLASASGAGPQNLPFQSLGALFKGREEAIRTIEAALPAGPGAAPVPGASYVIHGLGGVGKSRLAMEYAWRHLKEHSASLFVTADSRESLERNLASLCAPLILDLPEQSEEDQDKQRTAVLKWLDQNLGWLLILDNVDTPEAQSAVEDLLPRLEGGHVLITSRLSDWDESLTDDRLDELTETDAAEFLLERTGDRRTPSDTDQEDALALARTLGGLALALEQAGAFIAKKRIGLGQYRERWQQQEAKLREFSVRHYPRTLAVTWETSFEQLSPAARALLNLLSCFAPDPIPREIFEAAFDREVLRPLLEEPASGSTAEPGSADLEDLLEELESLSLLKWESGNRSFSIHRLVQEITRLRLPEGGAGQVLNAAVGLINAAVPASPPPGDVRSWPIWAPLRPHVAQVSTEADKAGIAEPTTRLFNELGLYLRAKGIWPEAEPLTRRALAIDKASYGAEHPRVAIQLGNLARLLQGTGRLEEAEPLMRRAVEILMLFEVGTGHEHPHLRQVLGNYRHLLSAMGLDQDECDARVRSLDRSLRAERKSSRAA